MKNSFPKIAVCLPSRGMMHSRTIEDIIENMEDFDGGIIFAHGMPQPDAENYLVKEALKEDVTHLWLVDDDMKFPPGILEEMIELDKDVVVADYPVAQKKPTVHIRDGKFECAGMGCVLIKPEVFKRLEEPYFRADTQYVWEGDHLEPHKIQDLTMPHHGLYDVDFWQRLLKAGVEPTIVNTKAGQYYLKDDRIKKWGNNTQAQIETWTLE